MPLLVVLTSPPEAVATQNVDGSASETAIAVMRPPIVAGPMHRHWNWFTQAAGRTSSAGVGVFGSAFGSLRTLSLACKSASSFSRSAICLSRSAALAGGEAPQPLAAPGAARARAPGGLATP